MRRAWIIGGSVLTVIALGWTTLSAVGVVAREDETVTTELDAAGIDAVDLRVSSGSIEVVGADTDTISLTVELTHGLRRTGHRVEEVDGSLVVRSSCPLLSQWCEADYRLVVPARLAVQASVDDGRLVVSDIEGDVDVDGDDGSVELRRLTGTVEATTDNGNVVATGLRSQVVTADSDNGRVSLAFATAPRVVEASTDNGNVGVVVPDDDTTYLVDLHSDTGSTDVGVRTDPESDRRITGRTHHGHVTVRYPSG